MLIGLIGLLELRQSAQGLGRSAVLGATAICPQFTDAFLGNSKLKQHAFFMAVVSSKRVFRFSTQQVSYEELLLI